MPSSGDRADTFQPVAAILGAALPGAGQFYLGYRRRGAIIFGGVMGLFLLGMLVGGLDSVDRRENGIWFIGQALVGPTAFGVDWVHQTYYKGAIKNAKGEIVAIRRPNPGEGLARDSRGQMVITPPAPEGTPQIAPPITRSVGRANEVGTLYSAIAGMMNLLVIADAALSRRREDEDLLGGASS